MAVFNLPQYFNRDTETGCMGIGVELESCKQTFYLKQQNQILKQNAQQPQATPSTDSDQKLNALESSNAELLKITDQQNQQITQLIQSSEQSAHKIDYLISINIIFLIVLVAIASTFLTVKILKLKNTHK